MKNLFLFLIFLAPAVSGFCQKLILQGKIVDETNNPIAYASLFVLKNGKPVAGKISADDGSYKLSIDTIGTYELKVTHASFISYSKTITLNTSLDNEIIVLQRQNKELSAVTITAKSNPTIERKIDRVVMNIEKNALTSGRNSLDLLSLAPGVFVNYDGTIFIGGISGTRVMINGKLLNLSRTELSDYLRNLRSDDIKSVEIIAHPGAEYDASGSGGLINIVLKKNTQTGLNGSVGLDYTQGLGKYPGVSPKANLNFHTGKFGITSSYSYLNQKDFVDLTQSRTFPDSGFYNSRTNSTHHLKANNVRVSATYDINSKQYIGIDYTGQFRKFYEDNPATSSITYPNPGNNTNSKGAFPMQYKSDLSDVGLNYYLTTDTLGSKLAVMTDYTYYNKNTVSNTNSQTFNADGKLLSDTIFNFINPSTTKITTVDAHYEQHFKSGTQLSFGGKASITRIQDNNSYDIFKNNEWVNDGDLGFDYRYRENVYAGFVNLSGKIARIEYKIGLRAEKSNIESVLTGGQDTTTHSNYLSFFPDVFFKRSTNKSGSNYITLSYNRRITRPSFSQLNPYKYYIDNFTIQSGNPFLTPQFTSTYAVGYLLHNKYYFETSYSDMTDNIAQYISTDPQTGIATLTNGNVGKNTVYTATMSIPVQITKAWTTNNVLLLTYTQSKAQQQFNIKEPSFFLQTSQTISISPTVTMNINAFYTPTIVQGNTVVKHIGTFDIGVMKKFMKNKFSVKAALNHLFFSNYVNGIIYYDQKIINFRDGEQRRFASLTLNYNFNAGKIFKTKTVESSNSSEKSRL